MKPKLKIKIRADGLVEWLGDECPLPLPLNGTPTRRRVSTIQPNNNAIRMAFLFLRRLFGDRGRVASWTRTWRCQWKATILSTGQTALFTDRQAAIDWEYSIINAPRFEL